MPLEARNAWLARFRAQYTNLRAAHPQARLYALIDTSTVSHRDQLRLSDALKRVTRLALYSDTGLDDLTETGPFLLACPEPDGVASRTLYHSLNNLSVDDCRTVSWIWTIHPAAALIGHLQTLLHARLAPDDVDAWFFFHQTVYLPVLHGALPEATRRYMFGPVFAWWCRDPRGELVELAGENLPLPPAWDAFPVPKDVVSALDRAGAPAQVLAWLQKFDPSQLNGSRASEQLQRVTSLVEKAMSYGIAEKVDLGVYAAYGLRYGAAYDEHPALQEVLTPFRKTKRALIDAYAALDEGVWPAAREIAIRRAGELATQAHQEKLRKQGCVQIRVRVLNCNQYRQRDICLHFECGGVSQVSSLCGELQGTMHAPVEMDVPAVAMPLPGAQATVRWIAHYANWECAVEVEVTGELPKARDTGLAIVKFGPGRGVSITLHAEDPKPGSAIKGE